MKTWTIAAALALGALIGCASSPTSNRVPMGEIFPSVQGTGLDGTEWQLPADLAGAEAILLIGYVQNAQFDIDRWLIGLDLYGVDTRILEVPTIKGLFPGLFADAIDNGMRGGIPRELWEAVVTVYDGADALVAFTGNERPANARALVVDDAGRVVYFHDAGFSAPALKEMVSVLPDHAPRIGPQTGL